MQRPGGFYRGGGGPPPPRPWGGDRWDRSRSPPRARSRSRSPPPRWPQRDREFDDRGPPARRDGPSSIDADPDSLQWSKHLAPPPEDGTQTIKLAGVVLPAPPAPEVPFWRAIEWGLTERVEAYLSGDEDVNQLGGAYGSTPLGWAAFAGDLPMLQLCLTKGADVHLKAKKGATPLHMAVWNGDNANIVEALLGAGADPQAANQHGQSALEVARWFDNLEKVSGANQVFALQEWRARWKRPEGRERCIALLEAAAERSVQPPPPSAN